MRVGSAGPGHGGRAGVRGGLGRRGEVDDVGRVHVARQVDADGRGARPATRLDGHVGVELSDQLRGRRAQLGVAVHRGGNEPAERRRQAGEIWLTVHDPVEHGCLLARAVGRTSRAGHRDGGAPGVHVDRRGDGTPEHLLRRDEAQGAGEVVGAGECGDVGGDRQPQVDHLGLSVQEKHVGRSEISMHDAGVVQGGQRVGDPPGDQAQRGVRQRTGLGDDLVQAAPRHETGDQVGLLGVDVGVEHLDQVRAAHPAQGVDLVAEPLPRGGVGDLVAQHLDGHRPLVGRDGQEDGAGASLAQPPEQAVRTDPLRVGRPQRRERHDASWGRQRSGPSRLIGGPVPERGVVTPAPDSASRGRRVRRARAGTCSAPHRNAPPGMRTGCPGLRLHCSCSARPRRGARTARGGRT